MGMDKLTDKNVAQEPGLEDWRILLRSLHACFRTGSLRKGLELANRIGAAADEADHHPDLNLRYFRVLVELTTHDANGITQRDVDLARTISGIAAEMRLEAEPLAVSDLEIAIDAIDIPAVLPFWRAVMGYRDDAAAPDAPLDAVVDPLNRHPAIWFQQMDAPRPQRNRIHVDVTVPQDVVEQRVQDALDAGGRLVSDNHPAFWVLADPEGNEACVCSWQGRD